MYDFWGSKNSFVARNMRCCLLATLIGVTAFAAASANAACELPTSDADQSQTSFFDRYDFFSNYGNYMPRVHCLQTAEGSPDWMWISLLIGLNLLVISGYLRIFHFWRGCYNAEECQDRDVKLMELAWIFAACATCGYGLSILMFFWPVYRLLAIALVALAFITWRFAIDLEPFRKSFTAHRLYRQLNEALQKDNHELEAKNRQLKLAHEELAQATDELTKSNSDLDEFVYAASHDLKSPLRAIASLSQFVCEDEENAISKQSQHDLAEMQGRVQRMERMLNGLLHYSRAGRSNHEVETFPIRNAIQQAIDVLDIPSGFEIRVQAEDIEINCPRPPLEQVLRNLVDNAIKHHPNQNGQVAIEVKANEQLLRITVADDGAGIANEYRERVFDMFKTLRRRDEFDSSGMGLALVKRIVERQGGIITLSANEPQGVKFQFTWPLHSNQNQTPALNNASLRFDEESKNARTNRQHITC